MKKKITMVLAGLGLCASMMMFSGQEADANPCVYHVRRGAGSLSNACYGTSGSCQVNICLDGVIVE